MKITPKKLKEDISGDSVTIDFNNLIQLGYYAVFYSKNEVYKNYNNIVNSIDSGDIFKANCEKEYLKNNVEKLCKSIDTLSKLSALTESNNNRETLYLFGLNQEVEKIESTYQEK